MTDRASCVDMAVVEQRSGRPAPHSHTGTAGTGAWAAARSTGSSDSAAGDAPHRPEDGGRLGDTTGTDK